MLDSYSYQEPYGEGSAQITFPQITEFDNLGSGDVSWLKVGADVTINRVAADGTVTPKWCGFIMNLEVAFGQDGGGVTAQCSGAFAGEIALRMMRPEFFNSERDIAQQLKRILSNTPLTNQTPNPWLYRFTFNDPSPIYITSRKGGSRNQTILDYCDELLAIAQDPTDNVQWTIGRKFAGGVYQERQYELRKKSNGTTWTVQAGGRGVSLNLSNDLSDHVNAVYGEGVSPRGERWRNAKYPDLKDQPEPENLPLMFGDENDDVYAWQMEMLSDGYQVGRDGIFGNDDYYACTELQAKYGLTQTGEVDQATWDKTFQNSSATVLKSAYFAPIAHRKEVEPNDYSVNGAIIGSNADFDKSIMRVERITSYGENTYKADAKKSARREPIFREVNYEDGWWHGDVTLMMDPQEGSRLDIKEGDTILLKDGVTGARLLHVVGLEVSPESDGLPVRLTVDVAKRDAMTVAMARSRNREARMDPAKNFINQRRKSSVLGDVSGWDAESGAGQIHKRSLKSGWNVFPVMLGQQGSIEYLDVQTYSPAQEFVFALFGDRVTVAQLDAWIGDPLAKNSETNPQDPFKSNKTVYGIKVQDFLDKNYFVEAWGTPDEPAGYWPASKGDNATVTGKLRDEVGWSFAVSKPPWGYVAVWVKDAGKFKGNPAKVGKFRSGMGMLVSIQDM